MTATHALSEELGWDYFARLGQQDIMQVQSSTDPPKKLALGERALQVDGNEYVAVQHERRICQIGLTFRNILRIFA